VTATRAVAALLAATLALAPSAAAQHAGDAVTPGRRDLFHLRHAPPAAPAESWVEQWLDQRTLFGDWLGLRSALRRLGIVPTITWVTDVQGNPIGGQRQGLREFDTLYVEVDVALETLMGAPGTAFHVGVSQRSGTSLSDRDIGNVWNVAQTCCGATFFLVDLYLEQPFLDRHLNVRAGRIAMADEFMTSPLYWLFVNSAIDGNPGGIFRNAPGASVYPQATWGLRARVDPTPEVYAMAGVFNGDPTLGANSKHGADFSMRGPLFAIAEIGYRLNQARGSRGLPGNYKIGAYYNGGAFTDLLQDGAGGLAPLTGAPPQTTEGTAGWYVVADQMVYREGGAGSTQGLTPFVSLLVAPDASINPVPLFLNGGVVYRGLIPRRDNDIAAFGVVYGQFSGDLRRSQRLARQAGVPATIQDLEIVLEWTYVAQVARWLAVQPNVQYVIKPGGSSAVPNALVLGMQLSVTF
jgi:porin